jgi:hypothetical protein
MLQPVAVLGVEGWINTPKEKLDVLWAHFYEANYSQSTLSRGQVYSYPYLLQLYRDQPSMLQDKLQDNVTLYLSNYFSSVTVQVSVHEDPTKGDALTIEIFVGVKDEYGKEYTLSKVLDDVNSYSRRWINMNNYGDPDTFGG